MKKFLNNIGQNLGFDRFDVYNQDTEFEFVSNFLYRELLKNLINLLNISGTRRSYELFFSALGYDIQLLEYWWDSDGNLVEKNYLDDGRQFPGNTRSTFRKYTSDGVYLNQISKDPVRFNTPQNNYNIAQKSNFVQPIISKKPGFAGSYTLENRQLIRFYLNFLKPIHIKYFSEILVQDEIIDTLFGFTEIFPGSLPLDQVNFTDILNEDFLMDMDDSDPLFSVNQATNYNDELGNRVKWNSGYKWNSMFFSSNLKWNSSNDFTLEGVQFATITGPNINNITYDNLNNYDLEQFFPAP